MGGALPPAVYLCPCHWLEHRAFCYVGTSPPNINRYMKGVLRKLSQNSPNIVSERGRDAKVKDRAATAVPMNNQPPLVGSEPSHGDEA